MRQATADLASSVLNAKGKARSEFDAAGFIVTQADCDLAETALAWAREHFSAIPAEKRNGFDHNMFVCLKAESVTYKGMGFVAYAVQAYLQHQERLLKAEIEKKAGADSVHLGVVGEKLMLKGLTFISKSESVGDYGVTYCLKFMAANGSKVTWWASGMLYALNEAGEQIVDERGYNVEVAPGDKVNLFGTVKGHSEWMSTKETAMTRCKALSDAQVVEVEAKEAAKAAKEAKKAAKAAAKAA